MTARKTSSSTKKTPTRKASPRKKAPVQEKAAAKKTPVEKKAAAKKAPPRKKAAVKKAPAQEKAAAKRAPGKPKGSAKPEPAAGSAAGSGAEKKDRVGKGGVTAGQVNLGHVFALRPRVSKSFRQEHFRTARLLLEDEAYASVEEAARAVVEKALSLTREKTQQRGRRPGP